ncbi:interferon-induced protein 44 isoform X2 [Gorilla gorilla gorilla]|uniref:interferon-induced protein 44 isoform X2 n=1 Tax=Gorilla gorilla gorilla TaxID=9595 RepID=UPI0024462113|nr:interferon-induced protein 44 isoform X2 [Gorilla gorilla gorilla]
MAVTTRLTWLHEKILQNHFGGKRLSLLYKGSVHGFRNGVLLDRCCNQGPTLTVIYSEDHIIGAYAEESYQEEKYASIILFALQETKISEWKLGLYTPETLFCCDVTKYNSPTNFQIDGRNRKVIMDLKTMENLGLAQNCTISIQDYEVFRCEDSLDERKIKGVIELRKSLLSALRTYEPYGSLVQQIRILLLGPIGAGKSSFFNSVRSVFQGHVTHQALVGTNTTGISEKYRTYSIRDGKDGKYLPFILCDSLGLSEKEGGLCRDDIFYILNGNIRDRYQFNPMESIKLNHHDYIDSPSLKDRIHCVAFVFDASSIEYFSSQMIVKIKRIRRELVNAGVVHVALLTHVDSMDLITKGDLIEIERCVPVRSKVMNDALRKHIFWARGSPEKTWICSF